MDAMKLVLDAYDEVGWCKRKCTMSCFGSCCCAEEQKKLKKKHFFRKWLQVEEACLPDNIKWENLGTSARERRMRSCVNWTIAFILIVLSLIGIVIMKNYSMELKREFNTDIQCPKDSVLLKEEAYYDQQKNISDRIGYMHCYCMDHMKVEYKKGNFKALEVLFTEFDATDKMEYCVDWFENFVLQKGMVVGTSVVIAIINVIACTIFERTVSFERKHTINDETMA